MTDVTALTPASTIGGTSLDQSRLSTKGNLEKAGQQFEAVFTGMMLKSMRAAKLADPLFDSKAIDTFNDMGDQKLVQSMAQHTPLGIGKAMTEFLGRSQAMKADGQAAAAAAGAAGTALPGDSPRVDTSTG